jgi:hypothetical protein
LNNRQKQISIALFHVARCNRSIAASEKPSFFKVIMSTPVNVEMALRSSFSYSTILGKNAVQFLADVRSEKSLPGTHWMQFLADVRSEKSLPGTHWHILPH